MGAPVVWFEVAGRDFDTLSKFYTELFHWKVDADNPIGYGMVETGGEGVLEGHAVGRPQRRGLDQGRLGRVAEVVAVSQ